jgi:hypothetical protein
MNILALVEIRHGITSRIRVASRWATGMLASRWAMPATHTLWVVIVQWHHHQHISAEIDGNGQRANPVCLSRCDYAILWIYQAIIVSNQKDWRSNVWCKEGKKVMVSVLFHGKLNKYTGKPLQVRLKVQSKDKTLDEFCNENAGAEACAERVNEE